MFYQQVHTRHKMNEILNNFLLGRDRFMPEMHLRRTGFTYNACQPLTKDKERIQKFKETGHSRYIYQNGLDKVCFQYDMTYGDFKQVTRWTASDKILPDEAFNIAKNTHMMNIKRVLWVFYNKNTAGNLSILKKYCKTKN